MAGPIRQPIDLDSLSRYIEKNVPEIQLPFDVKQVPAAPDDDTHFSNEATPS